MLCVKARGMRNEKIIENGVCPYGGGGTPQQSTYTPPSPKVNLETYPTQMNVGDSSGLK